MLKAPNEVERVLQILTDAQLDSQAIWNDGVDLHAFVVADLVGMDDDRHWARVCRKGGEHLLEPRQSCFHVVGGDANQYE